ncbi:MAG: UvrD-helicase domain-containing protein [Clostridia bacterium]|nr:UvrD-helicase domain-containing protein [Clostridia bacterium]
MERTWTPSQEAAMSLAGKSILVSAAAGSGKTSVLTERIIRSLTDRTSPADLSRLLVVTFTRAAAAELKGRIATALSEAMAENPGDQRLARQLLLLGSAQISTIDSFFQKIVRSNFEALGLPATFRIADESETLPISMGILEGLIEEFYERFATEESSSANGIDRLIGNRFAEALDHIMSNRSDGKLTISLFDFWKTFGSYPEGIGLLAQSAKTLRAEADKPFFETACGSVTVKDLLSRVEGHIQDLLAIQTSLEYDPDVAYKCNALISSDLGYCRAMAEALQAKDYLRAQSVATSFLPGTFPTIKNKPDEVVVYHEWRKKFKKEIAEKIQPRLRYSREAITEQMLRTAELCEILHLFYSQFESRMMAEKNARGILEHNDVRAMVYRLLSDENGEQSAFAKTLSQQYDAVYIDEYQDVDLLQDRIFSLIGGNRRFMVGDIKQSIYGFRGSDPSIFAKYRRTMPLYTEEEAHDADGVCVFMSDNFRCDRSVIDFTNTVCSFLFSACEESVGYRSQDDLICGKTTEKGYVHPVRVAVFEKAASEEEEKDDEERGEATWVAAEISRLLREKPAEGQKPLSPSKIAILVRTRANGVAFAKALEALHIPVASEAASDLLQEPLAVDLLNLLRVIDNPYRDLPLSEFLLSPFGGLDLEELTAVREAATAEHSLFDAMCLANEPLETALLEKIAKILEWLKKMRKKAEVLSADRFLRELYREERLVAYSNDPCFLVLYDQARCYQKNAWCGLYGFLSHLDKLSESGKLTAGGFAPAEDAVTIMTIHHSKGLEFPVVFLASCGAGFNRQDTYESLLFHKRVGGASKLYRPETGESEKTVLHDAARWETDAEQTEEGIRTLYVALTRAKERLYVTGTLRGGLETALNQAKNVRYGNRSAILGCNSFLAWILAALQSDRAKENAGAYVFEHIYTNKIARGEPISEVSVTQPTEDAPAEERAAVKRYADVKKSYATYAYPLDALRGLPTKVAASKLSPNLLDTLTDEENDKKALEAQINLMHTSTPSLEALLDATAKPSATDIGTATHAFLEFCDFRRLYENGVEEELARLLEKGFLGEASANIIHRDQLHAFRSSNLMQWILEAKEVRREQKFSLLLPLASLTANAEFAKKLGDQTIFVQGSIDLLLTMPDGRLLLVDYKTDRLLDGERESTVRFAERMTDAHGSQLAVYASAINAMFGKQPDASFIYSLPLGSAVEIPSQKE